MASDQVKNGRLPGTVRSDDGADLTSVDRHAYVRDSHETIEGLSYILQKEHLSFSFPDIFRGREL